MGKICNKCGIEKDLTAFYSRMGRCKDCHKVETTKWSANNQEKVKAARNKWRAKPGSREKEIIAARRWQEANPERFKRNNLKSELKRLYGLSIEQYESLYLKQDGLCAICKVWKDRLHVDHNHETHAIRSLLCSNCNTALGLFKDSSELLSIASAYLKAHNINNPLP